MGRPTGSIIAGFTRFCKINLCAFSFPAQPSPGGVLPWPLGQISAQRWPVRAYAIPKTRPSPKEFRTTVDARPGECETRFLIIRRQPHVFPGPDPHGEAQQRDRKTWLLSRSARPSRLNLPAIDTHPQVRYNDHAESSRNPAGLRGSSHRGRGVWSPSRSKSSPRLSSTTLNA